MDDQNADPNLPPQAPLITPLPTLSTPPPQPAFSGSNNGLPGLLAYLTPLKLAVAGLSLLVIIAGGFFVYANRAKPTPAGGGQVASNTSKDPLVVTVEDYLAAWKDSATTAQTYLDLPKLKQTATCQPKCSDQEITMPQQSLYTSPTLTIDSVQKVTDQIVKVYMHDNATPEGATQKGGYEYTLAGSGSKYKIIKIQAFYE